MRRPLLMLALFLSSVAPAHELDREAAVPVIEPAKTLPQTVVLRRSKSDPSRVEVLQVKERLARGQKFDSQAMAAETGKVQAKNELDAMSSTSSWRFGYYGSPAELPAAGYTSGCARGYLAGCGGPRYAEPFVPRAERQEAYDYNPNYRYGDPYPYGYDPHHNGGFEGPWTPYYEMDGYRYDYRPYYAYADTQYDYTYFGYGY